MHRKKLLLLAWLVTLAAACGGDSGSPTAPTPTPMTGEPAAPSAFGLSAVTVDLNGNTFTFTWGLVPDATYI